MRRTIPNWMSTIFSISLRVSGSNITISSIRFRNSGLSCCFNRSMTARRVRSTVSSGNFSPLKAAAKFS